MSVRGVFHQRRRITSAIGVVYRSQKSTTNASKIVLLCIRVGFDAFHHSRRSVDSPRQSALEPAAAAGRIVPQDDYANIQEAGSAPVQKSGVICPTTGAPRFPCRASQQEAVKVNTAQWGVPSPPPAISSAELDWRLPPPLMHKCPSIGSRRLSQVDNAVGFFYAISAEQSPLAA